MKVLELEQKLQNEKMENDAQKKYQEMKQKEITDLRASHSQLNFQVEGKLEESAENMNQLILKNKTLTLEKEALYKKSQQWKKDSQRVPQLEQQVKEYKELA